MQVSTKCSKSKAYQFLATLQLVPIQIMLCKHGDRITNRTSIYCYKSSKLSTVQQILTIQSIFHWIKVTVPPKANVKSFRLTYIMLITLSAKVTPFSAFKHAEKEKTGSIHTENLKRLVLFHFKSKLGQDAKISALSNSRTLLIIHISLIL